MKRPGRQEVRQQKLLVNQQVAVPTAGNTDDHHPPTAPKTTVQRFANALTTYKQLESYIKVKARMLHQE